MKLPAVCLAAIFAGGVALGLYVPLNNPLAFRLLFVLTAALLAASAILLRKDWINSAASVSVGEILPKNQWMRERSAQIPSKKANRKKNPSAA